MAQDRNTDDSMVKLSYVMSVLSQYHVSGSFEYLGNCQMGLSGPDLLKLRAPKNDKNSPIEALREVFADDRDIQITQDHNGMIRIVEENVAADILNVNISHLTFKKVTDPFDALAIATLTKEVSAFKKAHNLGPEFFNANHEFPIPLPKSPILSSDLRNVSLSQALDEILKTFPGLWMYRVCPSWDKSRNVDFAIYQNNEGLDAFGSCAPRTILISKAFARSRKKTFVIFLTVDLEPALIGN